MKINFHAARWLEINRWTSLLLLMLTAVQTDTQEVICRPRRMDIVFVLDGSNSVRPWHFKSTKDAVKSMVDDFKAIGPDSVQIGLMQYGSVVKQEFYLGQYQTKEEVNEAIDNVEYMARGTMTGLALKYLVTTTFTESHGARMSPDVSKLAVFITDGRAQDPRDVLVWHNKVKNSGVEVFVIGVGRHISDHDLRQLASDPKEKHVYHVTNFQSIQSIHVRLDDEICAAEINECENGTDNCEQNCTNTVGSFECSCIDGYQLQDDGFSCFLLLPTAPVRLQISDITHTSARVSWSLGSPNGTSKVDHYTVTYQPADGSSPPTTIQVSETETVLNGLNPGTNYNISVKSHGHGLESDPLEGNDTTLFLGVTTVTVSNPTLTTLHAEWVPAGGDLLTGYSIKVHELPDAKRKKPKLLKQASRNVKADVHDISIDGLQPGTKYKVTVIPRHAKLIGEKGSDTGTTLQLSPPEVTIPQTTFTTARVEWTSIGVRADNFTVRLLPTLALDGKEEKVVTTGGSVHTTLFTGLKPGTKYTAFVSGSVSEGGRTFVSEEGTAENETLSLVAPNVSIPVTTFTTAKVKWGGIGAVASRFEVRLRRVGGLNGKGEINDHEKVYTSFAPGDEDSTVFTDLTPGTMYTATVVGFVLDGEKELASPQGSGDGTTLSLLPPNVTVSNITFTTATVTWDGIGTNATHFAVRLAPADSDGQVKMVNTSGDTHSAVFTGLNMTTKYTASVVGFVQDGNEEMASPEGKANGTTLSLVAPNVEITTTLTTARVSWDGVGAVAKAFTVRLKRTDAPDGTEMVMMVAGNLNSTEFTGLTPGATYTATVVGHVIDGSAKLLSPEGTATGTTSLLNAPMVTIPETTIGSVTVNWDTNGTKADKFIVQLAPADMLDSDQKLNITVDGSVHSTVFKHLTPTTKYVATVVGYVNEVASPEGTASGTTLPIPYPKVSIPKTSFTTLDAKWTWNVTGDILGYIVTLYRGSYSDPDEKQTIKTEGNVSSATFTDLTPGTLYNVQVTGNVLDKGGIFEASDTTSGSTLDLIAPNVTIPNTTFTTATVNWTGVGAPAERFEVTLNRVDGLDSDEGKVVQTGGADRVTVFTNLAPGVTYTATVTGFVKDGEQELSSPVGTADGTTLNLIAPLVTIPKTTFTTAQVNWTGIGAEAERFEIRLNRAEGVDGDEEKIITTKGQVNSALFTDLTPGTVYTATVTGFVTDGMKELASPVGTAEGLTLSLVGPNVTIPETTYTTARVEWTGIGAEPIRFEISLKPTDGGEEKVTAIDGSSHTVLFTDLDPGTMYLANVTGFVMDGEAELSSPIGSAVGTTLSLVAPDVTIPNTTFTTATVKWSDVGADAKKFQITLTSNDDPEEAEQVLDVDGDTHTTVFTGLVPGTTYTATVVGIVDDAGKDFASPEGKSEGTTKTPPTPTIKVTNTGLSILDVMWTIPGDPPQQFEITYFPTDEPKEIQTIKTMDLSTRLRNLTTSTEYTIKVNAVYHDGGETVRSPVATTKGTTKNLTAPNVDVLDTSFTSGKIQWSGVGMAVHHWIVRAKIINGSGPGNLREDDLTQPPGEQVAALANLDALNEAEVIGVVVEDGKEFLSPVGSAVITIDPVPPPRVNVTDSTLTTLDASWEDDIVPDNFVIQISAKMPFDVENLETYLDYLPGKDAKTVDGGTRSNTFENLIPGTEYFVTVWAKVLESSHQILSLAGLSNGATKPLPPENLSLEETPSTTLKITFDPPSQGGASSFEVKCVPEGTDPDDVAEIKVANKSPESTKSTSCTNLSPGVTYEVWARTVLQSPEESPSATKPGDYNMNKQKYGPYYSEYVKANQTIAVGPVNLFKLDEPTPYSLLATWLPPDNVDEVDHYVLAYKPAGSEQNETQILIPGNETSKLLAILHPDTLHEANIFPVVNSVTGPKAEDSEKTLKDNVSIQVTGSNFTSISVEWPISQVPEATYRIYWSPKIQETGTGKEPTPPSFVDVGPGQTTTTLSNLLPATTYNISIDYVYQTAPPGKASTVGSTGLPPPGPINFTDVQDTSFVAHWGKPDFEAQPIGYHVTYTGPDGILTAVDVVGPDTLSLEIDDAQPGSIYDFTVAADYGDMGLSDDVTAKVTTDEPVCSCATYVRRQQQLEKTIGKLVDIIGNLQEKIDNLQDVVVTQAQTKCETSSRKRKREAPQHLYEARDP